MRKTSRTSWRRSPSPQPRPSDDAAALAQDVPPGRRCRSREAPTSERALRIEEPGIRPSKRLPIHRGNSPIDADLPVERGATLRIYEWRDYLADEVLDRLHQALRECGRGGPGRELHHDGGGSGRLRRPDADFDVFFPTTGSLSRPGGRGRSSPLTHELLPNRSNLWPYFRRTRAPSTTWGSATACRTPSTPPGSAGGGISSENGDAPEDLANPYDAYWNERYRGRSVSTTTTGRRSRWPCSVAATIPTPATSAAMGRAVDDLVAMAEGWTSRCRPRARTTSSRRASTRSSSRGPGTCSPPSGSGRSQPTMPASSPTPGLTAASSAAT